MITMCGQKVSLDLLMTRGDTDLLAAGSSDMLLLRLEIRIPN